MKIGCTQGDHCVASDGDEWTWTLPQHDRKTNGHVYTPLVGVARQIFEERLAVVSSRAHFHGWDGGDFTHGPRGPLPIGPRRQATYQQVLTHDLRRTVATPISRNGRTHLSSWQRSLAMKQAVEDSNLSPPLCADRFTSTEKNNTESVGSVTSGNYRRQIADRKTCLFSKRPRSVSSFCQCCLQWAHGAIPFSPRESEPRSRA